MKKISFYLIVDFAFKAILFFILNLIWCLYFFKQVWVVFTLTIMSTILCLIIFDKISHKKIIKSKLALQIEQCILNISSTFIYMDNKDVVSFYYKLISKKHFCESNDSFVKVPKTDGDILVVPIYKFKELNEDDVLLTYKSIKKDNVRKIIFLCSNYDAKILRITSSLTIKTIVLNIRETYNNLLVPYEFYPEIMIEEKPSSKQTFKQILCYALNKKKTKGYLISAFLLIFASFFVYFKIYYLVISTILIVLSIISFYNPTFNKVEKQTLID